jgi:hypothetical protein
MSKSFQRSRESVYSTIGVATATKIGAGVRRRKSETNLEHLLQLCLFGGDETGLLDV